MSFALPKIVTKPVGAALAAGGTAFDYLTPGSGSSTATNAGKAILDPNKVYTGSVNPLYALYDKGGFTQVQGANSSQVASKPQTGSANDSDSGPLQYGGGGGGGSVDWSSVADAQAMVDQANSILSRLASQKQVGLDNISGTFSNYRSGLEQDFNRNKGQYDLTKNQTINDQLTAKAGIDSKVRARANALSRLLGSAGAGDSQAALELAPYAAARTGTQLRNQVNQAYGKNLQGLDLNWNQYNTDYSNSLNDLTAQEANKRKELEAQILQQELDARDNMRKGQSALEYARTGNASAAQAIRNQALPQLYQILQQIDQLGRQDIAPVVKDATYSAPDLAQYTTENTQPVAGIDPSQASDISPAYQYLLKKQLEDQQTFGY